MQKSTASSKQERGAASTLLHYFIILMMSSAAPSNDDDVNPSLSVVQTVKKWFQISWPLFGGSKIDESESNVASARSSEEATANEKEAAVVYLHQDDCASVDDHSAIVCGHYEENEETSRGDGRDERDEASSSALSNEQFNNNNDNHGPGSRVMDLVKAASPKKYFLRNRRRRKSCRFQLLDDVKTTDVVASASTSTSSQVNNNNILSTAARSSDELHPNAAPTLPQDTTTSTITTHQPWTQTEVTSLRNAYQQSDPTSTTLWHDIATIMGGERTASECQRKWFSLVATPKKRVAAVRSKRNGGGGRVNTAANQVKKSEEEDGNEEEDDLFDSTPLKYAVQEIENDFSFQQRRFTTTTTTTTVTASTKQQPLEQDHDVFHSPNKMMTKMIKSPLPKRPRMFSPKTKKNNSGNGGNNDTVLSPLLNRRKGYNTYVNNLRREMNRAQKAKKKGCDTMSNDGRNIVERFSSSGNKSNNTIRIKEGKGKSQLSAELSAVDGTFVLNIPCQEDGNEDHDCDIDDVFEEVFRMEDEENEFP